MQLDRYHGLGNDYLVLSSPHRLDEALVRAICDRHVGVGSDGVLEPAPAGPCDHGVRIWNPDGSIAEKSGNGLRIFARWLVDVGRAGRAFSVWTGSERVGCEVGEVEVAIEMGRARFQPAEVPFVGAGPWVEAPVRVGEDTVTLTCVGLGNPHAVALVDVDPDTLPWRRWGAALETHGMFPNRTNVQFARALGRDRVEARIWERGAGETMASGSSACAVAAAAVRTGRCAPGWITVQMPGGSLRVEVRTDGALRLEGPVERVGRIHVDKGWLAARGTDA